MPVSSDIYSQIQQPQPLNRLAQLAQMQQVQLGDIKTAELARQVGRQNALSQVLATGGGADDLRKAGFLDESLKVDKASRENRQLDANIAKTTAETGNIDFEQGIKKAEHAAAVLSLAKDQGSYDTVLKVLGSTYGPKSVAQMPAVFDPAYVQAEIAKGMTRTQQLADLRAAQGQAVTMRGQDLTAETARRGQDITVRGQNLVDARAREANGAGKVPAGYRPTADGKGLEFIPGGPADPNAAKRAAPTEFQGKSAMFGSRAQEADRIITELAGQYSPAAVNAKQSAGNVPLIGGALEAGGNLLLPEAGQRAEQAQRDFINAVLRLESGAAIAKDEFDNAKKQYFPQPGDGPDVIAQKAANRKRAIQGLLSNARPGAVEAASNGGAAATAAADNDPLGLRNGR